MALDPRDFITAPFLVCPKCKEEAFGVLNVQSRSYTRRCRSCLHKERILLPELNKRIIYLDQLAISELLKAIHPDTRHDDNRTPWKICSTISIHYSACNLLFTRNQRTTAKNLSSGRNAPKLAECTNTSRAKFDFENPRVSNAGRSTDISLSGWDAKPSQSR